MVLNWNMLTLPKGCFFILIKNLDYPLSLH